MIMKNRKCPNHKACWDYGSCEDCELGKEITRLHKSIDRLKKQNEKWEETCTKIAQCCTELGTLYKVECKRVDTVRADTVRKMQERLKEYFSQDEMIEYAEVDADYINERIDQIAKEMVEGL